MVPNADYSHVSLKYLEFGKDSSLVSGKYSWSYDNEGKIGTLTLYSGFDGTGYSGLRFSSDIAYSDGISKLKIQCNAGDSINVNTNGPIAMDFCAQDLETVTIERIGTSSGGKLTITSGNNIMLNKTNKTVLSAGLVVGSTKGVHLTNNSVTLDCTAGDALSSNEARKTQMQAVSAGIYFDYCNGKTNNFELKNAQVDAAGGNSSGISAGIYMPPEEQLEYTGDWEKLTENCSSEINCENSQITCTGGNAQYSFGMRAKKLDCSTASSINATSKGSHYIPSDYALTIRTSSSMSEAQNALSAGIYTYSAEINDSTVNASDGEIFHGDPNWEREIDSYYQIASFSIGFLNMTNTFAYVNPPTARVVARTSPTVKVTNSKITCNSGKAYHLYDSSSMDTDKEIARLSDSLVSASSAGAYIYNLVADDDTATSSHPLNFNSAYATGSSYGCYVIQSTFNKNTKVDAQASSAVGQAISFGAPLSYYCVLNDNATITAMMASSSRGYGLCLSKLEMYNNSKIIVNSVASSSTYSGYGVRSDVVDMYDSSSIDVSLENYSYAYCVSSSESFTMHDNSKLTLFAGDKVKNDAISHYSGTGLYAAYLYVYDAAKIDSIAGYNCSYAHAIDASNMYQYGGVINATAHDSTQESVALSYGGLRRAEAIEVASAYEAIEFSPVSPVSVVSGFCEITDGTLNVKSGDSYVSAGISMGELYVYGGKIVSTAGYGERSYGIYCSNYVSFAGGEAEISVNPYSPLRKGIIGGYGTYNGVGLDPSSGSYEVTNCYEYSTDINEFPQLNPVDYTKVMIIKYKSPSTNKLILKTTEAQSTDTWNWNPYDSVPTLYLDSANISGYESVIITGPDEGTDAEKVRILLSAPQYNNNSVISSTGNVGLQVNAQELEITSDPSAPSAYYSLWVEAAPVQGVTNREFVGLKTSAKNININGGCYNSSDECGFTFSTNVVPPKEQKSGDTYKSFETTNPEAKINVFSASFAPMIDYLQNSSSVAKVVSSVASSALGARILGNTGTLKTANKVEGISGSPDVEVKQGSISARLNMYSQNIRLYLQAALTFVAPALSAFEQLTTAVSSIADTVNEDTGIQESKAITCDNLIIHGGLVYARTENTNDTAEDRPSVKTNGIEANKVMFYGGSLQAMIGVNAKGFSGYSLKANEPISYYNESSFTKNYLDESSTNRIYYGTLVTDLRTGVAYSNLAIDHNCTDPLVLLPGTQVGDNTCSWWWDGTDTLNLRGASISDFAYVQIGNNEHKFTTEKPAKIVVWENTSNNICGVYGSSTEGADSYGLRVFGDLVVCPNNEAYKAGSLHVDVNRKEYLTSYNNWYSLTTVYGTDASQQGDITIDNVSLGVDDLQGESGAQYKYSNDGTDHYAIYAKNITSKNGSIAAYTGYPVKQVTNEDGTITTPNSNAIRALGNIEFGDSSSGFCPQLTADVCNDVARTYSGENVNEYCQSAIVANGNITLNSGIATVSSAVYYDKDSTQIVCPALYCIDDGKNISFDKTRFITNNIKEESESAQIYSGSVVSVKKLVQENLMTPLILNVKPMFEYGDFTYSANLANHTAEIVGFSEAAQQRVSNGEQTQIKSIDTVYSNDYSIYFTITGVCDNAFDYSSATEIGDKIKSIDLTGSPKLLTIGANAFDSCAATDGIILPQTQLDEEGNGLTISGDAFKNNKAYTLQIPANTSFKYTVGGSENSNVGGESFGRSFADWSKEKGGYYQLFKDGRVTTTDALTLYASTITVEEKPIDVFIGAHKVTGNVVDTTGRPFSAEELDGLVVNGNIVKDSEIKSDGTFECITARGSTFVTVNPTATVANTNKNFEPDQKITLPSEKIPDGGLTSDIKLDSNTQIKRAGEAFAEDGIFKYYCAKVDEKYVASIYGWNEHSDTDITIPDTVDAKSEGTTNTYIVQKISSDALTGFKPITKLTLGANIQEIASNALSNCTTLTEVDWSKATALKSIGEGAFDGCPLTGTFTPLSSLTEIGKNAFNGNKFNIVQLPQGITTKIANNETDGYAFGVPILDWSDTDAKYNPLTLEGTATTKAYTCYSATVESTSGFYVASNVKGKIVDPYGKEYSDLNPMPTISLSGDAGAAKLNPNGEFELNVLDGYNQIKVTSESTPAYKNLTFEDPKATATKKLIGDLTLDTPLNLLTVNQDYATVDNVKYLTDVVNGKDVATVLSADLPASTTELVIPSTITVGGKEYTVIAVGDDAYAQLTNLEKIVVSDTITRIGKGAFAANIAMFDNFKDGGMKQVNGNESSDVDAGTFVKDADGKFYKRINMQFKIISKDSKQPISGAEIVLDGQTFTTGQDGFANCQNIKAGTTAYKVSKNEFVKKEVVGTLDGGAYSGRVETVEVDNSTKEEYTDPETGIKYSADTSTGEAAIIEATDKSIKLLVVPEKITVQEVDFEVTEIADNSFDGCNDLYEVIAKDNILKTGNYAFGNCPSLTRITFESVNAQAQMGQASYPAKFYDYKDGKYVEVNSQEAIAAGTKLVAGTFVKHQRGGQTVFDRTYTINGCVVDVDGNPVSKVNVKIDNDDEIGQSIYYKSVASSSTNIFGVKKAYGEAWVEYIPKRTEDTSNDKGLYSFGENYCGIFAKITATPPEGYTLKSAASIDGLSKDTDKSEVQVVLYKQNFVTVNGVTYLVESVDGKRVATAYSTELAASATELVLPETVSFKNNDYAVKAINDGVFAKLTSLAKVVIPNNLEHIGKGAFADSVNMQDNVADGQSHKLQQVNQNGTSDICPGTFVKGADGKLYKLVDMKFKVLYLDDESPLSSGVVEFDGQTATSGTDGIASFTNVKAGASAYRITGQFVKETSGTLDDSGAYAGRVETVKVEGAWKEEVIDPETGIKYSVDWSTGEAAMIEPSDKSIQLLVIPEKLKVEEVDFPVTEIADNSFDGCNELYEVIAKDNILKTGNFAFGNCPNLTRVSFESVNAQAQMGQASYPAKFYDYKDGKYVEVNSQEAIATGTKPVAGTFVKHQRGGQTVFDRTYTINGCVVDVDGDPVSKVNVKIDNDDEIGESIYYKAPEASTTNILGVQKAYGEAWVEYIPKRTEDTSNDKGLYSFGENYCGIFAKITATPPEGYTLKSAASIDGLSKDTDKSEVQVVLYKQNFVTVNGVTYLVETVDGKRVATAYSTELDASATELVLPETVSFKNNDYAVKAINDGVFAKLTSLGKVVIPNNLEHIGKGAFADSVNMQDNVADGQSHKLQQVNQNDTSDVCPGTFVKGTDGKLYKLVDMKFKVLYLADESPSSGAVVEFDGQTATSGTDGIASFTNVKAGASAYKITGQFVQETSGTLGDSGAYAGRVETVKVEGTWKEEVIDPDTGIKYSADWSTGEAAIIEPTDKSIKLLVIPEKLKVEEVDFDVTEVADASFNGCNDLYEVIAKDNILKTGSYAFENCPSLTRISFESVNDQEQIGQSSYPAKLYDYKDGKYVEVNSKEAIAAGTKPVTGTFVKHQRDGQTVFDRTYTINGCVVDADGSPVSKVNVKIDNDDEIGESIYYKAPEPSTTNIFGVQKAYGEAWVEYIPKCTEATSNDKGLFSFGENYCGISANITVTPLDGYTLQTAPEIKGLCKDTDKGDVKVVLTKNAEPKPPAPSDPTETAKAAAKTPDFLVAMALVYAGLIMLCFVIAYKYSKYKCSKRK